MGFRYDIGSLRALAVLAVVMFHYGVPGFDGGYSGVDIFFVISGYLMTRIVLTSFEKGNFGLKSFYERRFKRIMPALLVVVLMVTIFSFFRYFPNDFVRLNKNSFFSIAFLSNFYYALNSSYFHPSSQSNALLHTWSLSVEWQFYMIYPILLLPFKNLYLNHRRKFVYVFWGLILLSFGIMLYFNYLVPDKYSKFVFYLTPFRAWEMLAGGLCFLFEDKASSIKSGKIKQILCLILFLGLIACIYFLNESYLWPSIYTVLPVCFTVGIILLNVEFQFMRFSVIQFIGNISYSLYLWHWPLIVFYLYKGERSTFDVFLLLIFAVLLSCLSYYFIENKYIKSSYKKISLALFLVLCLIAYNVRWIPNKNKFSNEIIALTEFRDSYDRNKQFNIKCHSDNLNTLRKNGCFFINNVKKNILLFGDSHAAQYHYSLSKLIDTSKFNIVQITTSGALPLLETKGAKDPKSVIEFVLNEFLPRNKNKFDLVLLSGHWYNYKLRGYKKDQFVDRFSDLDDYLKNLKVNYMILGQSVFYRVPYPTSLALNYHYQENVNYINDEGLILNDILRKQSDYYFDIYNLAFDKYDKKRHLPYMFDNDHFSLLGTNQVIPLLLDEVDKRFDLGLQVKL